MARNLYFTGIEELEESMRAIPDVDLEKLLVVKQMIVKLLHQRETSPPSSSNHPYRRFGTRVIDSSRLNLRIAAREETGSNHPAIKQILDALFVDPTPQYESMTTLLGRYRRYIEDMIGSDSDSE